MEYDYGSVERNDPRLRGCPHAESGEQYESMKPYNPDDWLCPCGKQGWWLMLEAEPPYAVCDDCWRRLKSKAEEAGYANQLNDKAGR